MPLLTRQQNAIPHIYNSIIYFTLCKFTIRLTNRARALLKKIDLDFVQPYSEVPIIKALKEPSPAVAGLGFGDAGSESPRWYRVLLAGRTYFERGTK